MTTFDEAFEKLIGHEGGYSNHPDDPGKVTMYGITESVARAHGYQGRMIDLPLATVKAIYRQDYWDKVRANELPEAVRFDVFDAAVNSGAGQAVRLLQRATGTTDDGRLGPVTLRAVIAMDPQLLDKRLNGYRLRYMTELKNWPPFARGWAARIATNLIED
jgi:lysozyme family protein